MTVHSKDPIISEPDSQIEQIHLTQEDLTKSLSHLILQIIEQKPMISRKTVALLLGRNQNVVNSRISTLEAKDFLERTENGLYSTTGKRYNSRIYLKKPHFKKPISPCSGAPKTCKGCKERRQCEHWNHYIRRLISQAIKKRLQTSGECLLYVRMISKKVHRQAYKEGIHWLHPRVNNAILSLPGVKFFANGRTRGAKDSIAGKIYKVTATDLMCYDRALADWENQNQPVIQEVIPLVQSGK